MLIDCHVHPDYSIDAKDSIDEYCRQAQASGVSEICFTPHYDRDPQRTDNLVRVRGQIVATRSDWLDTYFSDIEEARREYSALQIGAGLEIDYQPELEEELAQILGRYPFDFVIGSVHCLNHLALTEPADCQVYFTGRTARQVCVSYFRVVKLAVQSGLFDCIGHLDIFKRFGRRFYGPDLTQAVYGLPEGALAEIAKRGMSLEVNSAGWRHDCRESYPGVDLLSLAYDCGVKRITLGSDAHEAARLGDGVKKAAMIAQEAGFDAFCTYRNRQPLSRPFAVLRTPATES